MNTLRLVRMLFSKRLLREALIVLQVILMVVLLNAVILPFENLRVNQSALNSQLMADEQRTIYYTPSLSYAESYFVQGLRSESIINSLRANHDIEAFAQNYARDAAFEQEGAILNTTFNVYSDALSDQLKLPLEKGEFAQSKAYSGERILPIVISNNLEGTFRIGDTFTLGWLGEKKVNIPCVVTGVLKEKASFITFGEQNGVLSYNTAYQKDKTFLFAKYDADILKDVNWNLPMLLQLREDVDLQHALGTLREQYADFGEYHTIPELMEQAQKQVVESSHWNIMMIILFALVLLFGYGGYVLISAMQKSRLYAILYINGLSFRRMLWIHVLSGLILFVPAVGIGLAISPVFLERYVNATFVGFTPGTYAAVFLIFLLTFLLSVCTVLIQTRRLPAISLYKQEG